VAARHLGNLHSSRKQVSLAGTQLRGGFGSSIIKIRRVASHRFETGSELHAMS
jgi:hypothetical protein